jgi:hypothetical protein
MGAAAAITSAAAVGREVRRQFDADGVAVIERWLLLGAGAGRSWSRRLRMRKRRS